MKESRINISTWLENHKVAVGFLFLLFALIFSSLLLYQDNRSTVVAENKLTMLDERIKYLEDQLQSQKDLSLEVQAIQQPENESGSEAGGEIVPAPEVKAVSTAKNISPLVGKLNLNTASLNQLESLPGIGPTYAQRIIEYRQGHGGFKSVNEVTQVKGIGPKTYEKFRDKITVE